MDWSRICFHFRKVLWLMCISWLLASAYLSEKLRVKEWDRAREKIKEGECNGKESEWEREREGTVIFLWTGQVLVRLSPSLNMKRKEETVKSLTTQEACVCVCVCLHWAHCKPCRLWRKTSNTRHIIHTGRQTHPEMLSQTQAATQKERWWLRKINTHIPTLKHMYRKSARAH